MDGWMDRWMDEWMDGWMEEMRIGEERKESNHVWEARKDDKWTKPAGNGV